MKKLLFAGMLLASGVAAAQTAGDAPYQPEGVPVAAAYFPYQNPELSPEQRADDLLQRLTLEEKVALMQNNSAPVERLGIKPYEWWNEALHGVARNGLATVFPQTIGMAAAFNDTLLYQVFDAVSDEGRVKNRIANNKNSYRRYQGLTFWTPNVNIFRDPRWGRGQETYGEDPYLTGRLGMAVVRGLQGTNDTKYNKAHACAKHFAVHSGPEWNRHSFNAENIAARDLWETYLPAFKDLVQKAGVKEVMCAYNRYEGDPCCGSDRLLHQILRNDWGYDGIVVTDCGAIGDFYVTYKHNVYPDAETSSVVAVNSGTDIECGRDFATLVNAVRTNKIDEARINTSVRRLLKARFELGEMEPVHPFQHLHDSLLDCQKHRDLALRMARETMVLLQNNKNVLPLKKNATIAVVGPNANDSVMMWANYNGFPSHTTTLLEALRQRLPENKVIYEQLCDYTGGFQFNSLMANCASDGKPGFSVTYWNNRDLTGTVAAKTQVPTAIHLDTDGNTVFASGVDLEVFSGVYKTVFTPEHSGEAVFRMRTNGKIDFIVNGKTVDKQTDVRVDATVAPFKFEKGKTYDIELRFRSYKKTPYLHIDLVEEAKVDMKQVLKRLKKADVVLFAGGITPKLEGESMNVAADGFKGGDRTKIELPAIQTEMMQMLKKGGKKVVLVNFSGCAMALERESQICDAILQAWYPGQAGGTAVCDVLYGDYNPSGKLPVTFYKNSSQLPDFEDYSMKNRTYRYFTGEPQFPFGHGLSYTTFAYGDATIDRQSIKYDEEFTLNVPLQNTGKRQGEEVVQVYIKRNADTDGPQKTLRNFRKVSLDAKQSMDVKIQLPYSSFEVFDPQTNTMRVLPGEYTVFYGGTSASAGLKQLTVTIAE